MILSIKLLTLMCISTIIRKQFRFQLSNTKGRVKNGPAFFVIWFQMEKSTRMFGEGRVGLRSAPTNHCWKLYS